MNWQRIFSFNRPLADRLVPWLLRLKMTPNMVTAMSMIFGLLSGYCYSHASRGWMLCAAACLQTSFILDNADGQVARLRNMRSKFGMYLDFCGDLVTDLSIWTGLAAAWLIRGGGTAAVQIWLLCSLGSIINFLRALYERFGTSDHSKKIWESEIIDTKNPVASSVHILSHDGDPTVLLWIASAMLTPEIFLVAGAVYINGLWISAMILERVRGKS